MNPEQQPDQFELPELPTEELHKNQPRDEELFVDDALKVYLRDLVPNRTEQEGPEAERICLRRDFIETYEGNYETRQDFVRAAANELGWYEALGIACQFGNVPISGVFLDVDNIFEHLQRYYTVLEGIDTDRLHIFQKRGVELPKSQIHLIQRGGERDDE